MLVLAAPLFKYTVDVFEALTRGRYFGPGTDLSGPHDPPYRSAYSTAGELDALAYEHDLRYAHSMRHTGRRRRVERASADFQMAMDAVTVNPVASAGMFVAASARVLTFNLVNLPWD